MARRTATAMVSKEPDIVSMGRFFHNQKTALAKLLHWCLHFLHVIASSIVRLSILGLFRESIWPTTDLNFLGSYLEPPCESGPWTAVVGPEKLLNYTCLPFTLHKRVIRLDKAVLQLQGHKSLLADQKALERKRYTSTNRRTDTPFYGVDSSQLEI